MATPTALISGAGGGFGSRIAQALAASGWRVYAGMRQAVIAEPRALIQPLPLDLTDRRQIARALDLIEAREGRLDALIHCAGIDVAGAFEDLPEAAWREVMEVNFFGGVALARAALPLMRRQGRGVIVALSSLSGLVGLPGNSAYAASKFALEGAFESLRHEVARFGIEVALLQPGGYRTGMAARYARAPGQPPDSPYAAMVDACMRARMAEQQGSDPGPDPGEVTAQLLQIVQQGAHQLHYPVGEQAVSVAARLRSMDEAQRARFVSQASRLGWWIDGTG